MMKTSGLFESLLIMFSILFTFFGVMILAAKMTGNDISSMFPNFSWDMINWLELKDIINLRKG